MLLSSYPCLKKAESVFFIGIGGISMSSLACLCQRAGYRVAGSDRALSPLTEKLEKGGIPVFLGHKESHLNGFDAVVYTGAVGEENPELREAKRRNIPIVYRAVLLGEMMRSYPVRIGISGMHGKSGTTGMITRMLLDAGRDPTVVSGAEMRECGGAYRVGGEETFVFEACEYRDSFLDFFPTLAVMLNVDLDHVDYFPDMEAIVRSFRRFGEIAADAGGKVIANGDDENVMRATEGLPRVTFGEGENCDYRIRDIKEKKGFYSFSLWYGTEKQIGITLSVPGRQMIPDAAAAAVCGCLLGLSDAEISAGLSAYSGIARRFERVGEANGAAVYLDYGHHPKELENTLAAARAMTKGRVLCCFEPHTYSRTAALYGDFVRVLGSADRTVLLDVYAARETDTLGVDAEKMAKEIRGGLYAPSYEVCAEILKREAKAGDILLVLGAGTVYKTADFLLRS